MIKNLKIIFFLLILLVSCECVTELDTPKIISPDDYSEAILINAISDRELLEVESNEIPLLNKIDYNSPSSEYVKINSGNSFLRIIDDASKQYIINMPIELNKFGKYTIIFYGFRYSIKPLILNNKIEKQITNDKALFRFIHTAFDVSQLEFSLISNENMRYTLNFRAFTELNEISQGDYDIEIRNPIDNKVILSQKQVKIKPQYLYNFLLKGTSTTIVNKPLKLEIIESKIAE